MKRRKKREEIVLLAKHLEDKSLSSVPVSATICGAIESDTGKLESTKTKIR